MRAEAEAEPGADGGGIPTAPDADTDPGADPGAEPGTGTDRDTGTRTDAATAEDASTGDGDGDGDGAGDRAAAEPRVARLTVVAAAVVVLLAVLVHAGMVFFHVAPKNAVNTEHKKVIDTYLFPELAQNWGVFAPNPLLTNSRVMARAEVRTADGKRATTLWVDMTAYDLRTLRGTLVPSMTMEQFRQGWNNYNRTHDRAGRPIGKLGLLTEQYLKRLTLARLRSVVGGNSVQRIQFRELTQAIQPPEWTGRKVSDVWKSRDFAWLPVTRNDLEGTVAGR